MNAQSVVNIFLPNFMDAEKSFQMNLLRLTGSTSAVTIDFMLETLIYINSNSVNEALFIEESYLGKDVR